MQLKTLNTVIVLKSWLHFKQGPTYVKEFNYEEFQGYLSGLGDSLILVNDDEIAKVHVHTEDPGLVLQEGLKYGAL